MNGQTSAPHRVLHLFIEGFPLGQLDQLTQTSFATTGVTEIVPLTQTNTREVLGKIFAAKTIAVWGKL